MSNEIVKQFVLLGERSGKLISLRSGSVTEITEFFAIHNAGYNAVAIFLSRLDAEIFRQLLNSQHHDGQQNSFEIVGYKDSRLEIIRIIGNSPFVLVVGFMLDHSLRKLVIPKACYSPMCLELHPSDVDWLFFDGKKPERDITSAVFSAFSSVGEEKYLRELGELQFLDVGALEDMAREAVRQIGVMRTGNPTIPAVYSPYRKRWIDLDFRA